MEKQDKQEKEVSQMLAKEKDIVLADGKTYKLSQLGIADLAYFEEKFGTVNVLFSNEKPFTVIMHILYCLLRKNHPEIDLEDVNDLVTFTYINAHPELIGMITQQLGGQTNTENPPVPVEKNP